MEVAPLEERAAEAEPRAEDERRAWLGSGR